ncbi:MAG: glutamine synthetase family protein [Pseudomonadota bacterium]
MNSEAQGTAWLKERNIDTVEILVADMAGIARGKLEPAADLDAARFKLPIALFGQTINGTYYLRANNVQDRDMVVRPDLATLRELPWAATPSACVLLECEDGDGKPVPVDPRAVLRRVLERYASQGWTPVVAPEVEYYLSSCIENAGDDAPPERDADNEALIDPYGVDRMHDLADFFAELTGHCDGQGIAVGAMSQELGPGQFEANFNHGPALALADDVFHFKRTLKRVARAHGMTATFLAKRDAEQPGSSLHLHQSVYDAAGNNVFSNADGSASELFYGFLGGLQTYMREALLVFAPFENSYRRFLSHWSSPVNLEWGVDNRTVGLRVPDSPPAARRIENRLAGSDVNPYLVIAASLACGYLGMTGRLKPRPEMTGSAYEVPFALLRHPYDAIEKLRGSAALCDMLGPEFVTLYTAVKELECNESQERIPEWEREELMRLV